MRTLRKFLEKQIVKFEIFRRTKNIYFTYELKILKGIYFRDISVVNELIHPDLDIS